MTIYIDCYWNLVERARLLLGPGRANLVERTRLLLGPGRVERGQYE